MYRNASVTMPVKERKIICVFEESALSEPLPPAGCENINDIHISDVRLQPQPASVLTLSQHLKGLGIQFFGLASIYVVVGVVIVVTYYY